MIRLFLIFGATCLIESSCLGNLLCDDGVHVPPAPSELTEDVSGQIVDHWGVYCLQRAGGVLIAYWSIRPDTQSTVQMMAWAEERDIRSCETVENRRALAAGKRWAEQEGYQ